MNIEGVDMSKTVTIRVSDKEYEKIFLSAKDTHRPISNFITYTVLKEIEESSFVDSIEMEQIRADSELTNSLKAGHNDIKKLKGKFVD